MMLRGIRSAMPLATVETQEQTRYFEDKEYSELSSPEHCRINNTAAKKNLGSGVRIPAGL